LAHHPVLRVEVDGGETGGRAALDADVQHLIGIDLGVDGGQYLIVGELKEYADPADGDDLHPLRLAAEEAVQEVHGVQTVWMRPGQQRGVSAGRAVGMGRRSDLRHTSGCSPGAPVYQSSPSRITRPSW